MWYYIVNNQKLGPIDDNALRQLIATGAVHSGTFVWKDGMADWVPVGSVPELAALVSSGRQSFSATPPMGGGYGAPSAANVPDYMIWSILELLFCCVPFGIVGLVYAINANSAKQAGNMAQAMDNANKSKKFLLWGLGLWCVLVLIYIVMFVIIGVSGVAVQ